MRPFVNLSETIAGYRSNRSPLLIMLTEPTFCRNSSINISIDNRYDNRFTPRKTDIYRELQRRRCLQFRLHLGSRMRVLHSRGTAHPICELGVGIIATQQLDSLTVPSTPYVFNNCIHFLSHLLAGTNSFAIDLMAMKDYIFSASAPNNPPFLLVRALWLPVIAQWL